jgi:trans-2,3-dihydro-3-hydroxyanthranilate isomerase
VRIFTPAHELPFAGHPTIGTGVLLAHLGVARESIVLEEGVGPVPVTITFVDGKPVSARLTAARRPEFGPPPPDAARLAPVLGLRPDDLLDGSWAPAAVSCGVPYLIVPVRGDALSRARPDLGRWLDLLRGAWADSVYLVTPEATPDGVDLRARMFAPEHGVVEDPATGSAAVCCAGYLARRTNRPGTHAWTILQGVDMGRPSTLSIDADVDSSLTITAVRVAGNAVLVGEGTISL